MGAAEKKFDELCFQYGIELDDVVRFAAPEPVRCTPCRFKVVLHAP